MTTREKSQEEKDTAQLIEKLYMENTLLRIAGALFCHDAKRAPKLIDRIEINKGLREKQIVIEPHPNYGRPGPLAHKVFIAVLKKLSNYGRPIPSEIAFSKRELVRLIGRANWSGRTSAELSRALREIQSAFIECHFKAANENYFERRFNIFSEILLERSDASSSTPILTCTVTLAEPIVASLRDHHFTCLNYVFMQKLGTVGQALYMRMFFHFSNLFDGHHKDRVTFRKRYRDVCSEWLGGITPRAYVSEIERDQIGPHLRQLKAEGFIGSYRLEKARGGDDFILAVKPGAIFFQQYDLFYRGRHQGDLQFSFHEDQKSIAEPLKVAYLFVQKKTGQGSDKISGISPGDKQAARDILKCISFEQAERFIDYALREANSTNFNVQTLSGLKQYISAYLKHQKAMAHTQSQEAHRQRERQNEELARAYDQYCTKEAESLYQSLGVADKEEIDRMAQASSRSRFAGPNGISASLQRIARNHIVLQRYGTLPTLENWKENIRAA